MDATAVGYATVALICGVVTGVIAYKKGELFWAWLLLGCVLGVFGVVWAILKHPEPRAIAAREIRAGRAKQCPWCASLIPVDALVCPRCQQWVMPPPAYPPRYPPP